MFQVKKDSKSSTTKFEWKRADWIGVTILIVVCAAIFKGVDPLTILRWIGPLVAGRTIAAFNSPLSWPAS
jgi:hypothetical protein